eukprot:4150594-Pyramimonas_sp.AAC.2
MSSAQYIIYSRTCGKCILCIVVAPQRVRTPVIAVTWERVLFIPYNMKVSSRWIEPDWKWCGGRMCCVARSEMKEKDLRSVAFELLYLTSIWRQDNRSASETRDEQPLELSMLNHIRAHLKANGSPVQIFDRLPKQSATLHVPVMLMSSAADPSNFESSAAYKRWMERQVLQSIHYERIHRSDKEHGACIIDNY